MAKAIHMMIRVLDEQRSVSFYKRAFDLDVAQRLDFEGFTLVYLRNDEADFEIELTINKGSGNKGSGNKGSGNKGSGNKGQDQAYDLGNGYGHVAFCVDDLDAEHARFCGMDLEPRKIVEFERDGALLARFFFVADPDGYQIEVLERHGRYR